MSISHATFSLPAVSQRAAPELTWQNWARLRGYEQQIVYLEQLLGELECRRQQAAVGGRAVGPLLTHYVSLEGHYRLQLARAHRLRTPVLAQLF